MTKSEDNSIIFHLNSKKTYDTGKFQDLFKIKYLYKRHYIFSNVINYTYLKKWYNFKQSITKTQI